MAVTVHTPNDRTPAHWVATILGVLFLAIGLLGFVAPNMMGAHLSSAPPITRYTSCLPART
jgi:hypothetical protein